MIRVAGIDLQDKYRIDFALTKIYGIGWGNVMAILASAKIDPAKRTKELTEEETTRLQKVVDTIEVEGDLRRKTQETIKRLKEIGSYRGIRHSRNLPARGQRTRSNARTKRGKRVTIGAIRKEMAARTGAGGKPEAVPVKEEKKGAS